MPPSRKELKLDDLEPPPPNQLALANARSESDTARSQAQAVVGGKREPLDPPEKRINMLYKLPMDVVYEVFSHLHPRDLLTLARTSKRLRAFLTRRNCAFVWRASRALVGLLDPTKSLCMSEPAFANLLFSDHCHGCGMVSDDIMWPVPVRYCDGCRKINFGPATDRVKAIAWAAGFGLSDVVLFAHTTMKDVQIWHLPQLDEIEAKFKLVTLQDVNEKRRYVQAHMDYVAVWNEYMPTLFAWLQDYEDKLRTEDEVLQRKRCVAAMAKLRTMEWDREVDMLSPDDLDQLASLKSLTLESPLSDEDWGRIESNVMRFMSSPPEAFHSRKYSGTQLCWRMCLVERALRQYRHSKGTTGAALERASGLRFGDLAAMPNVRALLEDESPDLTREAFLDRLADMIPSLLVDWHKECKSYLISLAEDELQKAGMPLPEEPLTLDLAIMSFQCEDCAFESPLRWPEVLGHTCLRYVDQDDHPPPKGRVYETEVWRYLDLLGWDQAKWDPVPRRGKRALPKRTLSLDESLRSALAVITACGLDPKTATKEEMDEKGARFVCGFCSEGRSTREVYDWIGAIQHDLDNVWHSQNDQWIRLPDDLAVRARGVGPAVQNTEYICTWCYSSSTISSIRQHVQLHHEQENPKEGEDYYCQKTMCCIVTMFTENHMQDPDAQEQEEWVMGAGTTFLVLDASLTPSPVNVLLLKMDKPFVLWEAANGSDNGKKIPFLGCYQHSILKLGDVLACGGKATDLFGGPCHCGESFHKRKDSMLRLRLGLARAKSRSLRFRSLPHDDTSCMTRPQANRNASGVAVVATQPGGRRTLRGRRGGLKGMPDMPLDILFEIFGFLHPRDVVNLARTSKAFRALLMSRDAATFWRQARRKFEDLPDPPSYLSEPAYANLLFFPHCHNCLKPNIQNVVWNFSARFCKACYLKLFTWSNAECENLMWQMSNVEGQPLQMANLVYTKQIVREHNGRMFKPEIESMGAEWAVLKSHEEREQYIHRRRALVAKCEKFSKRMAEWKEAYDATRSSKLNDLKDERLRAVKEKLYDEGWGHILDNVDWSQTVHVALLDLKSVNKASRLTDKVWTNMRASVIELMERLQDAFIKNRLTRVCYARLAWIRMEDERLFRMYHARLIYLKTALETYRSQNIPRTTATDREPGFAEFASMSTFRDLIVQDESDDVVRESMRALLDDVPNLIAQWTRKNEQIFARKALDTLGGNFESLAKDPAALLELAIVSFACTRCRRTGIRWPGVLAHHCLRARRIPDARTSKYDRAVIHHTAHGPDAPFWGAALTVFDPYVHITRAVVSACALDPKKATFEELEGRDVRFVSDVVSTGWQQLDDWQAVRRYFMSRPQYDRPSATINIADHFTVASEELAAIAREQKRWALSNNLSRPDNSDVFGCGLCIAFGQYPAILSHLRIKHDVWNAEVDLMGQYLYLHEDSKPQGAPRVWLAL